MTANMFTAGYLAASDRAADELIDRDDDPHAESERWCPSHLHGADADEWRSGFESWWEPRGE
ncbi:Uncharacterised protein [Mycobacteroides abscessus]|uniref:hypothetical protein n=1 Tax=Mycobacteroides abscessus TaxID=36809 RepID=UPI0005E63CBA|nr:hypothetical protein [Mycobacteroides abscessus]CPS11072.1 Uncharacterised protein [Mycobacteroides abscessus]CPS50701.1 Uncharacterised protein [Mycobacteroides abscessus]CPS93459.1 Uncharacterised protein [Mycobacteroides abscessus]CPS94492.1 Uncharacterised protein [Mycobacteroides abscessus]CPT61484.1 Uncharacterised protein [Mycobacteroides abscessus]